jgi:hypothetical protein
MQKFMAALKRVGQMTFGPLLALLVIIGAFLLVMLGVKNVQIGGVLGALLGRKPQGKAIDTANSIPKDRVDKDGKLIPIGQADSKGITQVPVVPIKDPGLFSNPSTVQFQDPDSAKPVEVALPDGVKAKDIEHVIVVQPGTFAVTVKDNSQVSSEDVDALVAKYNKT